MVLFCLAVSQVVIINVKGDLGSEVQSLLQICAHSLDRLKVSKVKAPEIFFVLNQQADPDPNKHLDTIKHLIQKLDSESELLETEGVKISDLIQVSGENLFILPSAFNSQQMNDTSSKLFDSDVIKLSPTTSFAKKCTNLRLAIIKRLEHMPKDDRAPFRNMSEWMEMAGVVWDTIIKYQDIVKCKNVEELKCCNKLEKIIANLTEKHISANQNEFATSTIAICQEIKKLDSQSSIDTFLIDKKTEFNEIFEKHYKKCDSEFSNICQKDSLLRRMEYLCREATSNIKRLFYVVRKQYDDQISLEMKSILAEIKWSEDMKKFQSTIKENIELYCNYAFKDLKNVFEEIWRDLFGIDDFEEETREREENFSNLYSLFKMEYNAMENKQEIYKLFQHCNFDMQAIIDSIESEIITSFIDHRSDQSEQFVYTVPGHHVSIKDMVPYNTEPKYSYLCQRSLYETHTRHILKLIYVTKITLHPHIPSECESLLQLCSGFYNHPDIIWKSSKNMQVVLLKSYLKNPEDLNKSTWEKFVEDISSDVSKKLNPKSDVTPAVVKEIIHKLCFRIKLLNYEIGFIHASLSNSAARTLSKFVFAYAFRNIWQNKNKIRRDNRKKIEKKKPEQLAYFLQKIENHKMTYGNWNREMMTKSDQSMSRKYALDLIELVKRSLITSEQQNLTNLLKSKKEALSHESMLSLAYNRVLYMLSKDPEEEVTDTDDFVVQYICNRNSVLQVLFQDEWEETEAKLYQTIFKRMIISFKIKKSNLTSVLNRLLQESQCEDETMDFESDNYFGFVEKRQSNYADTKEIPFKAMNTYLNKFLDPTVTPEEFELFLNSEFLIDHVKIDICKTSRLPRKPKTILNEDIFRKLINIGMFNNTELIFNLHTYIKNFKLALDSYELILEKDEFQEMTKSLKSEFEKNVIGCPSQCPSCGKFCEREIHTNEGKCQIKTGHQIASMGGKIWNADENNSAIMIMCDDYKNYTQMHLSCGVMEWGDFKDKFGNDWDWDLPNEEKYRSKQQSNQKIMRDIWNKFGRGILNYHHQFQGTEISFVPYTTYDEVNRSLLPTQYFICFVIDGTGSMSRDISRVIVSVGQLIDSFISRGDSAQFRVVIYRDHCDDILIETFPSERRFTANHKTVGEFLTHVVATGGGDYPEAVLDGLAVAATQSDWKCSPEIKNKIIHIFDAPPHGDFPNYTSHSSYSNKGNCCCCNQRTKCTFDWDKHVWSMFKKFNIEYHAINTTSGRLELDSYNTVLHVIKKKALEFKHMINIDLIFSKYESKMRKELGYLCGNFQVVGKEVVNDAILKIFVDFKKENET